MKREVMKTAWRFVKNAGYTMSEALKKAWRFVKFEMNRENRQRWYDEWSRKFEDANRKVREARKEKYRKLCQTSIRNYYD
jgi:hypothetical protein